MNDMNRGTSSGGRMSIAVEQEELLTAVAVLVDGGVVDGEEGK